MPTQFSPPDFNRLIRILESLNECIDASAQRQLVTGAFRFLARGNEVVAKLRFNPVAHAFVVGLIDDLDTRYTTLDGQKTLAVLIQHVADEVLIEGDNADFLRGLLSRYFGMAASERPASPKPQPTSPVPVQATAGAIDPKAAELTQIQALLAQMNEQSRADTNVILAALEQRMVADADAAESATALRTLALRALSEVQATHVQLREQLGKLTVDHQAGATGYLSASIPLIPGILQYNVELGSQHTADLKKVVERMRAKIGLKWAKHVRPDEEHASPKPFVPGQMHGLFVGVNHYEDTGITPLRMAVKDVSAVSQVLAPTYRSSTLLTDETPLAPTYSDIYTQLTVMAKNAEPGDLLLFFFSGHGIADGGESYLLPRSASYTILRQSGISVSEVCKIMNGSHARAKVLILDACHSGAQIGKAPPQMTQEFMERVYEQAEGIAIISSCRQGEVSWEAPELGHGVFSHYLLHALSGLADFTGKGFVTVRDVYEYVNNAVKAWAQRNGRVQRPTLKLEVDGDIILNRYAAK